jgi:hypothetical protein
MYAPSHVSLLLSLLLSHNLPLPRDRSPFYKHFYPCCGAPPGGKCHVHGGSWFSDPASESSFSALVSRSSPVVAVAKT